MKKDYLESYKETYIAIALELLASALYGAALEGSVDFSMASRMAYEAVETSKQFNRNSNIPTAEVLTKIKAMFNDYQCPECGHGKQERLAMIDNLIAETRQDRGVVN